VCGIRGDSAEKHYRGLVPSIAGGCGYPQQIRLGRLGYSQNHCGDPQEGLRAITQRIGEKKEE